MPTLDRDTFTPHMLEELPELTQRNIAKLIRIHGKAHQLIYSSCGTLAKTR